jgi:TonB family protein
MKSVLKILGVLGLAVASAPAQVAVQSVSPSANETEATPRILQLGDPVELGQSLRTIDPVIPDRFRKKNGFAVLHGIITTDGAFKDLVVVSGDPALAATAIAAVQQWRYSPCTLNGAPVELPIYLAFDFKKGGVKSRIEPDLAFPIAPTKPIEEQLAAGQLFRIGGGVTPPRVVNSPNPEFSETARVGKFSGVVVLSMIIEPDGVPGDIWVKQKLGLGLDQKAIETVRRWRFRPATKNGQPVAVPINVEVSFHLY